MPVKAETDTPLGAAIRRARENAGLSQTQLGEALNPSVDQSWVSRWERGLGTPALEQLAQIEPATGVAQGTLFRAGGYIGVITDDVEAAALADEDLTDDERTLVLGVIRGIRAARQLAERSQRRR